MTPTIFRNRLLKALNAGDEALIDQLVFDYQPQDRDYSNPNRTENHALQLLGMFGYSGRVTRYKYHVHRLLANGLVPTIHSCAYLLLFDHARKILGRDRELVNKLEQHDEYPLHAAAERGDIHMVTWLCEKCGAFAVFADRRGELPIMRAMHAGPWKKKRADDVVAFLTPLSDLENALWFAAANGDVQRVQSLLRFGRADVNEKDESSATPLYHACHNNHVAVVKALLAAGADVNIPSRGMTPLATACLHYLSDECDVEIIKALYSRATNLPVEAGVILQDSAFIRSFYRQKPDLISEAEDSLPLELAVYKGKGASLRTLIDVGVRPSDAMWVHIERIFGGVKGFVAELREIVSSH